MAKDTPGLNMARGVYLGIALGLGMWFAVLVLAWLVTVLV